MEDIDSHFIHAVQSWGSSAGADPQSNAPTLADDLLWPLFEAQCQSRHLDFAARSLQQRGEGFYTIGSAGHEANAALGLISRTTDPALLHYRSGGFYAARAGVDGSTDPIRDVLRSLTSSVADPMSGGRHKVFGHPRLNIIPQTSTIGSHLPRAVGLAFAIDLAAHVGRLTPWPGDAITLCSFGDASVNHSTAAGALNAAAYLRHRGRPCPILFVCEDNGLGISTRTPVGWTEATLRRLPDVEYFVVDGTDPLALLSTTARAIDYVRDDRAPAVLHLRTVRFMGHAGSDVEIAYRTRSAIAADFERDPLLATARTLVSHSLSTPQRLLEAYERTRSRVATVADEVSTEKRLTSRAEVMAPLQISVRSRVSKPTTSPQPPADGPRMTLAQAINRTLQDLMEREPEILVFGEDVAVKGGVYGVTRGLVKRFGSGRVFDTLLDEQTVLGTALGASLAGFLPIPEIQYLAYLHNAEDQLRGEAASLRFFSNSQYQNGMVVRVAGLAYQRGFGGHFHNDNSVAVLRDIPGIVVAVPSHPADAPGMLRACVARAREEGRVCVFLEPIALYHSRDLFQGDDRWTSRYAASSFVDLGEVASYGDGDDVLIVTFGNGVHLSLRAAAVLAEDDIACRVLDLRWISPLPVAALTAAARSAQRVLVVDETRHSGGVAESVMAALVEDRPGIPIARVTSADSYIPLGPAAQTVLLSEEDIQSAARKLAEQSGFKR